MTYKPRICFDFDGVIHSYTSGWKGETVCEDPPVEGIKELMESLANDYQVVVFSSRCSTEEGYQTVMDYLAKYSIPGEVWKRKPPAKMYIDDRGIQFHGDCQRLYEDIKNFEHWIKKG